MVQRGQQSVQHGILDRLVHRNPARRLESRLYLRLGPQKCIVDHISFISSLIRHPTRNVDEGLGRNQPAHQRDSRCRSQGRRRGLRRLELHLHLVIAGRRQVIAHIYPQKEPSRSGNHNIVLRADQEGNRCPQVAHPAYQSSHISRIQRKLP